MLSKPKIDDDMPIAVRVRVRGGRLLVNLEDGRLLDLPLSWFRSLSLAPERAQKNVRIVRPGLSLRWPTISYELGVGGLSRQTGPLR